MRTPPERDPLGTPRDVAEYIGVSMGQLANLRWRGNGPPFVKFGKSIRYRWSEVDDWLEINTRQQTGPETVERGRECS